MAQAYKCDRCGKFNSGKPAGTLAFGQMPNQRVSAELCDECEDSLDEFLDGVGLSRETDCRTERLEIPTPTFEIDWSSVNIGGYNIGRDTCLKEMREMGGRNY